MSGDKNVVDCKFCGAVLKYSFDDVRESEEYLSPMEAYLEKYIVCPECGSKVILTKPESSVQKDLTVTMHTSDLTELKSKLEGTGAYILASVDGEGVHVGRFKGLSVDADGDLVIEADIDSASCTSSKRRQDILILNKGVNGWVDAREALPPFNVMVKVKLTNGCEAIDFVNEPLDEDTPFQHYLVSHWRMATREELREFVQKANRDSRSVNAADYLDRVCGTVTPPAIHKVNYVKVEFKSNYTMGAMLIRKEWYDKQDTQDGWTLYEKAERDSSSGMELLAIFDTN